MDQSGISAVVFHSEDGENVAIQCPQCRHARTVPVKSLRDLGRFFTVNCRCGEKFMGTVDSRKHLRKKVDLDGSFVAPDTGEPEDMVVEDLSLAGIRFATLAPNSLESGMRIKISFTLDTPKAPVKHRTLQVISAEGLHVSGRFVGAPPRDSDLGFYLMP